MTIIEQTFQPRSASAIEQHEHFWRTTVADRLAIELRPTGPFQRFATVKHRDLGDLLITDWDCPDIEVTRPRRAADHDAEALLLLTVIAGRQIIETPHETVVLRPGGILLMSTRTIGKVTVPETLRKRTVRIPLTSLSPFDTGPGIPDCLHLDTDLNPLAGLAHDYLVGVTARQIDRMTSADVEIARNGLLSLIAGMTRARQVPDLSETDFLPLLRRQMEEWIVAHLWSGAISVRELAAAHSVAPRTVHRAFAATGDTVGSVARTHRVAGARSDLVNTNLPITTIAHRWGFCDTSHMARQFRREFSMSPGDYRDSFSIR